MEYFSVNAFYLGMLLFGCMFMSNVFYSLICLIWKIRIIEFGLFFDVWFVLYHERVDGIKYILGWLPLGSHIRPLGMTLNDDEKRKIGNDDLPFAFFNKPKYVKVLFRLVPFIIYLIPFLISIILLSNSSIYDELEKISNFILEAFKTMVSKNFIERQKFVMTTEKIISGKNVVLFAFTILILIILIINSTYMTVDWVIKNKIKETKWKEKSENLTALSIFIFLVAFLSFVFSFFTVFQNVIYVISFLVGVYSGGIICFFTTLYFVKNISNNLSGSKLP